MRTNLRRSEKTETDNGRNKQRVFCNSACVNVCTHRPQLKLVLPYLIVTSPRRGRAWHRLRHRPRWWPPRHPRSRCRRAGHPPDERSPSSGHHLARGAEGLDEGHARAVLLGKGGGHLLVLGPTQCDRRRRTRCKYVQVAGYSPGRGRTHSGPGRRSGWLSPLRER